MDDLFRCVASTVRPRCVQRCPLCAAVVKPRAHFGSQGWHRSLAVPRLQYQTVKAALRADAAAFPSQANIAVRRLLNSGRLLYSAWRVIAVQAVARKHPFQVAELNG